VEKVLRDRESELRQKHEQLQALTARLITAQDMERRRISLELHDDFSQQLASLSVDIQRLQQNLPKSEQPIGEQLQQLRSRVLEIAKQVHLLAYRLHPSVLEHLGLVVALRGYIDEWSTQEKIKATFIEPELPVSIPDSIAACLYRIAQEALRNVARHSRSSRVTVTLSAVEEVLMLSVRDWGVGIRTPGKQNGPQGLGLLGMRERVHLMNGKLSITSKPKQGTEIVAEVPLVGGKP
jgi:two-component system, NarL family, sensor kinase